MQLLDFENIAFTHTQDQIKYLSCADCEQEVLGYQDLTAGPRAIFVAVDRISYDKEKAKELKQNNHGPSLESLLSSLSPEQLQNLK